MNTQLTRSAWVVSLCCSVLLGCATTKTSHVEQHLAQEVAFAQGNENSSKQNQERSQKLNEVPASVSQALMDPVTSANEVKLIEQEKYDINARGIDAASFFAGLVKDTPYSVAVHPEVSGLISLDLKQVTLDKVFSLVSDLYDFRIDKKDTVYRVMPNGLRTETFSVNYLLMQRDGNTQISITSGGVSQGGGNQQNGLGGIQGQNGFGGAVGGAFAGGMQNGMLGGMGGNGTSINTSSETNFWASGY